MLFILTELTSVFFSGIIYGWAPMSLILADVGRFHELCPPHLPGSNATGTTTQCDAQTEALSQVFSLAAVTFGLGGVPLGFIVDNMGAQFTCLMAATLNVIGRPLSPRCGLESS